MVVTTRELGGPRSVGPRPVESETMGLLSAPHIFQDLPRRDVEALMSGKPMWTAKAGTLFYGADESPEVLFLLKSGKVELYQQSPAGRKLTVGIVEQGTIFGEISLLGQLVAGTYAVAIDDSVICALSREDVKRLVTEHPTVALRIMEVLAVSLQQARDALQEMAFSDVAGRVASLLLRLSKRDTNVVEGYSHQNLASMVGCLRESLTVTLDQLSKCGAVKFGRKRVDIVDRSKLEWVFSQRTGAQS